LNRVVNFAIFAGKPHVMQQHSTHGGVAVRAHGPATFAAGYRAVGTFFHDHREIPKVLKVKKTDFQWIPWISRFLNFRRIPVPSGT
jgi:hypothetical protein